LLLTVIHRAHKVARRVLASVGVHRRIDHSRARADDFRGRAGRGDEAVPNRRGHVGPWNEMVF
jgi:hypothetical protein